MTEEPVQSQTGQAGDSSAAATGRRVGTDGPAPAARRGNRRAVSDGPAGLLPVTAKEDDPRAWGDSPEDNDAWLREQRPPHWG